MEGEAEAVLDEGGEEVLEEGGEEVLEDGGEEVLEEGGEEALDEGGDEVLEEGGETVVEEGSDEEITDEVEGVGDATLDFGGLVPALIEIRTAVDGVVARGAVSCGAAAGVNVIADN